MFKSEIQLGDIFLMHNELYILAQVFEARVVAICLADGFRWDEPTEVNDYRNITQDEFIDACGEFEEDDQLELMRKARSRR